MAQNQKNQAMVDAFGSGKPPVMSTGGKTKEKRGGRQRKSDNSDIDAIFRGIRSTRGMVRRGLSGEILNPDGTDPGNSFDRFMKQNPHLKGAAQRQAEYDQQARANSAANLRGAVEERRALQGMQQQNPNLVTGADGYRTLFDGQGKVIGTTKPINSNANWSQDNAINRGTASGNEQTQFRAALQQTGMDSVGSQVQGPPKPKNFLPGQSSPPGGASGAMVGAPQSSGNPGGETLFGSVPEFKSSGMRKPVESAVPPTPQTGPKDKPKPDWNSILGYGANTGPQMTMGPNSGPELPTLNATQIEALRLMDARSHPERVAGQTPRAPSRMSMSFSNYFPGSDYNYLQQQFPGSSLDQILQLFSVPAYTNQFK